MSNLGVVYLARTKDGEKPVEAFLASYERYPAGLPHDLLIVSKGARASAPRVLSRRLHELQVSDFGYDIRAYRRAAEVLQCDYLIFFNTFSQILDAGWLEKLYAAGAGKGVGAVGCTGSWESMYTNSMSRSPIPTVSHLHRLLCRISFDPFPNYHLRTNAFLIRRDLMLSIWPKFAGTKRGAYLFESGRNSFSNRILRGKLSVLVIGKNGVAYPKEEWARSHTFRSGNQSNLLVSDNQTRLFENSSPEIRKKLAFAAWGTQCDP